MSDASSLFPFNLASPPEGSVLLFSIFRREGPRIFAWRVGLLVATMRILFVRDEMVSVKWIIG